MFDTQLLKSFTFVADTGSITRAAELVNLTQSAVSAQIRKLENQAGCILLERTTRSLRLTTHGEVLLEYARDILALHEQAISSLGTSHRLSGVIRLGCSEGFVADWLFPVVGQFLKEHPDIEIKLHLGLTSELNDAARRGTVDIVVGAVCEDIDDAEVLWSEPLLWAFAKNKELNWSKALPLAFFPEPCPYRKAATTALNELGSAWRLACTSPSFAGVQAAALAGLAITPVTRSGLVKGLAPIEPNTFLPALPEAHFAIVAPKKHRGGRIFELVSAIRNSAYAL